LEHTCWLFSSMGHCYRLLPLFLPTTNEKGHNARCGLS
jgi:hypothetical protein